MALRIYIFIILSLFSLCVSAQTTVITFNLANYNDHGNWETRVKLIADEIIKTNADVVVLQEIRFNPDEASTKKTYQNMAEQVLATLHAKGEYTNAMLVTQPAMYYPLNGPMYPAPSDQSSDKKTHVWEGLSIISKKKILETGSVFLSKSAQCTDINNRITQYVKLDQDGQPLYIANIHFAFVAQCVIDNVAETLTYLQQMAGEQPLMVMGDYNTTPGDAIFAQFKTAGLVDLWAKLRPNETGYTYPVENPSKRIDMVWANAAIASKFSLDSQIWTFGSQATKRVYPSDHLGIAVRY